jgi:PLP dependent protein
VNTVASRWAAVTRQVADSADCVGRSPSDVLVVAVTKTQSIDVVRQACEAGISEFGENRVQEFLGKYGLFPTANWHFIGTLQTNKVKDIVGKACLIHSVDTLRLLAEIDKRALAAEVVQPVLLEVNVAAEESKHGFAPADVREVLIEASTMTGVAVRGFMTMAPFGRPEDARWVFRELRELRDSLREMPLNGVELSELSMGMSNDFRVAVEEGATIVRVGTAIFGR